MRSTIIAALFIGLACTSNSIYNPIIGSSLDSTSFANVDFIRTTDFNLTMNVNFD